MSDKAKHRESGSKSGSRGGSGGGSGSSKTSDKRGESSPSVKKVKDDRKEKVSRIDSEEKNGALLSRK